MCPSHKYSHDSCSLNAPVPVPSFLCTWKAGCWLEYIMICRTRRSSVIDIIFAKASGLYQTVPKSLRSPTSYSICRPLLVDARNIGTSALQMLFQERLIATDLTAKRSSTFPCSGRFALSFALYVAIIWCTSIGVFGHS
jgi:hypothetical protein